MCKASLYAQHHTLAKEGETYAIGTSSHGLPAFHEPSVSPTSCIVCVTDGKLVSLGNIPSHLQTKHGIGESATATFVDTGDDRSDMLRLLTGRSVDLREFAGHGVTAYIGLSGVADDLTEVGSEVRQVEHIGT